MIEIMLGDITKVKVDAIVNAANPTLLGGGGVDGAIHRAAGFKLLEECKSLGGANPGDAKITHGYNLPAKWVIHTVGPIYSGKKEDEIILKRCYENSLCIARSYHLKSIAFPSISTGAYGYPIEEACKIALNTIDWFLKNCAYYDMRVICVLYSKKDYDVYVECAKLCKISIKKV
ncbi:O-acetyl-ADP-ribose deacetylase [Caminibacter mediatlanticus TB-2]|uniref:O-acetyl-ADP-ribose deacetylase n=1 Tax=Caminibacter mediatlanticus TB-2 TaxID=391592 RepID=A0ABX5V7N4_9BACT|nr:O-acetyl-ADP-ribose deacetylase [Caminibacter mediatlanticus]QCT94238.1 O-acetyl-ADP-ribose deacetylase [Caminibacter mediatlanticus TB-2]